MTIAHGPELSQLVHLEDGEGLLVILLLLAHVLQLLEVVHALDLLLLQLVEQLRVLHLVLGLDSVLDQVVHELLGLVVVDLQPLLEFVLQLDVEVEHLFALDVGELDVLSGLQDLEQV